MTLSQKQIQHLYLRTGFGESPKAVQLRSSLSKRQLVEKLFEDSQSIEAITHVPYPIKNAREVKDVKMLRKILSSKKMVEETNVVWLNRMACTEAQFREKMTFFWHGHFATKIPMAYLMQEQNNTIRTHALGSFRQMLHAVSKDPAMLLFLNNQQNRKQRPNENFAREVMELFTLGEGNGYTENDIKEAGRAFTGWRVNRLGKFEMDHETHDGGLKTIFGRTGNFDGSDVIDMLLEKRQTANYISRKLYRFLISHKENAQFIEQMTDVFYESDYSIEELLRYMLMSDEFFAERNIGVRIASPTELLVRYLRLFKLKFKRDRIIIGAQKALGQVLLLPPNVAGWSEQNDWIDSSSLLYRMRLPLVLFGNFEMILEGKQDPEEPELSKAERALLQWRKPEADWSELFKVDMPNEESALIDQLLGMLIQSRTDSIDRSSLMRSIDGSSRENRIMSLATHIMALPEFQLI